MVSSLSLFPTLSLLLSLPSLSLSLSPSAWGRGQRYFGSWGKKNLGYICSATCCGLNITKRHHLLGLSHVSGGQAVSTATRRHRHGPPGEIRRCLRSISLLKTLLIQAVLFYPATLHLSIFSVKHYILIFPFIGFVFLMSCKALCNLLTCVAVLQIKVIVIVALLYDCRSVV